MKIILLGPPGSGKGTVSEFLTRDYQLLHISPGELLREEVQKGTTLGKKIKTYINAGKLVPSEFVVEMVKLQVQGQNNFILDGFPRSLDQAKLIDKLNIDLVLALEVSEEDVISRLTNRRVCSNGQHSYHLLLIPPKKEGICDIDGTPLVRRPDDHPKVIQERFRIYRKETEPVISYYKKAGKLVSIDASKSPEEVYNAIVKIVAEKQATITL